MPLGAFRLNSLARYVAAGGVSSEAVYNLSNLTYNARSYQIPKVNYVGDDSLGQPVFFVGTRDSSGNFVCSLFKRNNDGTISESAVTTLKSTDERFEAQGAAGFDTSGNPVGVTVGTYRVSGVTRTDVYCNQINKDALTLGTTYSNINWSNVQSTAGFGYATYLGNGRFGVGYRASGIRTAIAEVGVNSVTVSASELQESSYGDGVFQGIYGVTYQNDTDYRWLSANGNSNQHGVGWFAGSTAQGFAYSDTLTAGLARTEPYEITFDKMVTVARSGSTAHMVASSITWPASGNPSLSNGSITNFSDSADWNSSFCGATNLNTSTLYILYSTNTNGWGLKPITVSGTTITQGNIIPVTVSTSGWSTNEYNAACFANSSQGNMFVALIDDTGSNNPKIYFKEI